MIQEVYDIFAQRRYAERKPSRLGSATLGGVVVFALFVHLCCSNTPGKVSRLWVLLVVHGGGRWFCFGTRSHCRGGRSGAAFVGLGF